jgi:hypothetical protein
LLADARFILKPDFKRLALGGGGQVAVRVATKFF